MKMGTVKSSNIKAVGYLQDNKLLRVEFKSGGTYDYVNVPNNVFTEFIKSESLGKYFYKKIRNVYTTTKVEKGK